MTSSSRASRADDIPTVSGFIACPPVGRACSPSLDLKKRLETRIQASLDRRQLCNHLGVDDPCKPRHLFALPFGRIKKHVQRAQIEEPAVPVSIRLLV